ncbi:MAG TPA: N-acetylmuramoyl-L-alanine amidase [Thiotrichales bacterium]|nr:N-acetylmuramoyl-L-alanine amidase [Thiotrichales bacterium]
MTGIIIHCADTPNGRETTAADIDLWHGQRKPPFTRMQDACVGTGPWVGKGQHAVDLKHIGYHFVIRINGAVEVGRRLSETGAHCRGYNQKSIGICLAGTDKFTLEQWQSLKALVTGLQIKLNSLYKAELDVKGHRQLNSAKTCPGFDVPAWLENNRQPLPGHVLTLDNAQEKARES